MDDFSSTPDLNIACYRFYLRVTFPVFLPSYKGSTFRGGFGHGLNRIGPRFRNSFFAHPSTDNGHSRRALPKPFMLIPPLEEKTIYAPGEMMSCGLILFGETIDHFMIAFAAMEILGRDLGLGRNQGKFRIESVEQLTLTAPHIIFADDTWFPKPHPIRAGAVLSAHRFEVEHINLAMATRLRLKHNNRLVREPPAFSILFDRIAGRINSLGTFYGGGMLLSPADKQALDRLAETVRIDPSRTTARWMEWARPPKAGRGNMSFGGLLGEIGYCGELSPFVPWLALGQWIGVGGKTSFGLGLYHMDIEGGGGDEIP